MSKGMQQVTRREVLGGLGAATAGAAALSGLGVRNAMASDDGLPTWDHEADFVVVGAGCGLAGALAAAVAGERVIVLETLGIAGGTMALSGGVCWVPNNSVMQAEGIEDSREAALTYLYACTNDCVDTDLAETFVDRAAEMADFVQENTDLTWMISDFRRCYEYHPEFEGAVFRGRSIYPYEDAKPARRGVLLAQAMVGGIEKAGGEIMYNTKADRLITRSTGADGAKEVVGVRAVGADGNPIYIKAAKGVLLAAGGFDWNEEMRNAFLHYGSKYTDACVGCDGSGIQMTMSVGAALTNMDDAWGYPVAKMASEEGYADGSGHIGFSKSAPGTIMVNRYGERFCDEASDYDTVWRAFAQFNAWNNQDDFGLRNLPAYFILDEAAREAVGFDYIHKTAEDAPDYIFRADTLRELAEKLGIDPDGFEAAVAEFNENAANGVDPKFHRGESLYDLLWSQTDMTPVEELTTAKTLRPLDTPPFWGFEVSTGMLGTCGGAKVNQNAQVIDCFGEVIPRLYCCGNNSGVGAPGAGYTGGGATIAPALTFAYLAALDAATLEAWA